MNWIFEFFVLELDTPVRRQLMFQDPATGIMEGIVDLHHDVFFFLVIVSFFVLTMLVQVLYYFDLERNKKWYPINIRHDAELEIIWTIVPTLILIIVAVPSFALLYAIDEIHDPMITVKAVGHQWYWHYEYSDPYLGSKPIVFESRMVSFRDMVFQPKDSGWGHLRLLETDNRVVLPERVNVRLLITSADVLHSWAVPSFGVKLDACPGRLNETSFYVKRWGVFYGQCSEICGVNHGFMPISIYVVDLKNFLCWQTLKTISVDTILDSDNSAKNVITGEPSSAKSNPISITDISETVEETETTEVSGIVSTIEEDSVSGIVKEIENGGVGISKTYQGLYPDYDITWQRGVDSIYLTIRFSNGTLETYTFVDEETTKNFLNRFNTADSHIKFHHTYKQPRGVLVGVDKTIGFSGEDLATSLILKNTSGVLRPHVMINPALYLNPELFTKTSLSDNPDLQVIPSVVKRMREQPSTTLKIWSESVDSARDGIEKVSINNDVSVVEKASILVDASEGNNLLSPMAGSTAAVVPTDTSAVVSTGGCVVSNTNGFFVKNGSSSTLGSTSTVVPTDTSAVASTGGYVVNNTNGSFVKNGSSSTLGSTSTVVPTNTGTVSSIEGSVIKNESSSTVVPINKGTFVGDAVISTQGSKYYSPLTNNVVKNGLEICAQASRDVALVNNLPKSEVLTSFANSVDVKQGRSVFVETTGGSKGDIYFIGFVSHVPDKNGATDIAGIKLGKNLRDNVSFDGSTEGDESDDAVEVITLEEDLKRTYEDDSWAFSFSYWFSLKENPADKGYDFDFPPRHKLTRSQKDAWWYIKLALYAKPGTFETVEKVVNNPEEYKYIQACLALEAIVGLCDKTGGRVLLALWRDDIQDIVIESMNRRDELPVLEVDSDGRLIEAVGDIDEESRATEVTVDDLHELVQYISEDGSVEKTSGVVEPDVFDKTDLNDGESKKVGIGDDGFVSNFIFNRLYHSYYGYPWTFLSFWNFSEQFVDELFDPIMEYLKVVSTRSYWTFTAKGLYARYPPQYGDRIFNFRLSGQQVYYEPDLIYVDEELADCSGQFFGKYAIPAEAPEELHYEKDNEYIPNLFSQSRFNHKTKGDWLLFVASYNYITSQFNFVRGFMFDYFQALLRDRFVGYLPTDQKEPWDAWHWQSFWNGIPYPGNNWDFSNTPPFKPGLVTIKTVRLCNIWSYKLKDYNHYLHGKIIYIPENYWIKDKLLDVYTYKVSVARHKLSDEYPRIEF